MEKNNKRFERKPNLDFTSKLSKDGKYWIFTRSETWVLPRNYLDTISANFKPQADTTKDQTKPSEHAEQPKNKGKRNVNGDGKRD